MRLLPPDDAADLIQEGPEEQRGACSRCSTTHARKEVAALLAYAEDDAGGLMNPRYARLRPDMTRRRGDHATCAARRASASRPSTTSYVLDGEQRLLGVVSFRELFAAQPDAAGARRHAHRRRHGAGRHWTRRA